MAGRSRDEILYNPITVVGLYREMPFRELSTTAKRLVIADRLNRGEALSTIGSKTDARLVSRAVGEEGLEVLQDLLLLVKELGVENERLEKKVRRLGGG